MKTNNIRKLTAIILSGSMILGSTVTAFAADDPTSAPGTGNILSYSTESVIVPTSIKIALNPQGYTITKKEATTAADAEYETVAVTAETFPSLKATLFIKDGDNYVALGDDDDFDPDADPAVVYYKVKTPAVVTAPADTTADQIVTFNYGIANFSTAPKDVDVSLTATAASKDTDKTPITFVDTIKKAQAYDETTNADGAKMDELKMYLAVVASKDAPKLDENTAFRAVPLKGGDNPHNVTTDALADVWMENSTNNAGAVAFASDTTAYAKADIAFKLGEAAYDVKDYETLDLTTDQNTLKSMMEIKTVGDVAGFTFIGAMNTNADWTTADVTALTFTPTYKVKKITGSEIAVGGHTQIKTKAAIDAEAEADATTAAEGFKTTYADILKKTTETVAYEDLDTINAALAAYAALSETAQGKLTTEKALLDDLAEAAEGKAITDASGYIYWLDNTFWVGESASAGLDSEVFTAGDVSSVTIKAGTNDPVDVTDKIGVDTYSNTYWLTIAWSDISSSVEYVEGGKYVIVVTKGTKRYTAEYQF